MKPDQYEKSLNAPVASFKTNETAPKARIRLIQVTPFTTPEQLEEFTEDMDVMVLIVFATGTSPTRLNDVIKKRTGEGIPVLLVSNNPGDKHGIMKITYEVQSLSLEAGAIPLEKVNINNLEEIQETIQVEFAKGKKGTELGEAIRERFAYKEGEQKSLPDWEIPEKIDEQEKFYRQTLKRGNASDEEIEEIIKKWRGNK